MNQFDVTEDYLFPPGVWLAPFKVAGAPLVVAVDTDGEAVARSAVPEGVDPEDIASGLWEILEAVDPGAVNGSQPDLCVLDGGRD